MSISQTISRLPQSGAAPFAKKIETVVMAGREATRAARLQAALDISDALPFFPHLIDITEADGADTDSARLRATGMLTDFLVVERSADPSPAIQCLGDGLLTGGGAVLAVGAETARIDLSRTVLISWDGSLSAIAAISAAAPLLRRAETLVLSIERSADRLVPVPETYKLLASLGIEQHRIIERYSDVHSLARQAADYDAGLIVMGGFGRRQVLIPILYGGSDVDLQGVEVAIFFGN